MVQPAINKACDCPQCGLLAEIQEFYVTGEEKVDCPFCGYERHKTIEGTKTRKGYGAIHYNYIDENEQTTIIKLESYPDVIYRHKVIMELQENPAYDIDQCCFYVWNDEDKKLECLLGELPKSLSEIYEEQRQEAEFYKSQRVVPSSSDDVIPF